MSIGIERKLTTVLAADVAGYGRLMEADEVASMAALQNCRRVFAQFIERHRGRIANTAGDGLIADFPSVVEAVQCAVEVQRELAARHDQGASPAMPFRIGLHLGDVMVDKGDLFGEGVNIAARLQSMAEPGGVLISQAVHDQVHSKLSIGYEFLGARRPKNSSKDVGVYRLILDGSPPAGGRARWPWRRGEPSSTARPGASSHDTRARHPVAAVSSNHALRDRVIRHTKQLGIIWAALLTINLLTGDPFWAIWPAIGAALFLGLEAAPLVAQSWIDVQIARLLVIAAGSALINLASWSGEPWFIWPVSAALVIYALRQVQRPSG